MARTETLNLPRDQWTEITNANATAITFQVKSGTIFLAAVVGAVPPTSFTGAVQYRAGQGELALPLASLAPGTAGANRVYAYPQAAPAEVYVSHA